MAEALLRKKRPDLEVKSAGLFAIPNQPLSQNTVDVLTAEGMESDYFSQQLAEEQLDWADLILTMTDEHRQHLIMNYPAYLNKIFTLKGYVSEVHNSEKWERLKAAYVDYFEKKAQLQQANSRRFHLGRKKEEKEPELAEERNEINDLEREFSHCCDISDPFGGNVAIYQQTMKELDKYIDLLIKKINK